MKQLIDIDQEMAHHEGTIDEIYQKLVQGEPIVRVFYIFDLRVLLTFCLQTDAVKRYNIGVETKEMEYKKKTTRQKYAKSAPYVAFHQGIYVCLSSRYNLPRKMNDSRNCRRFSIPTQPCLP